MKLKLIEALKDHPSLNSLNKKATLGLAGLGLVSIVTGCVRSKPTPNLTDTSQVDANRNAIATVQAAEATNREAIATLLAKTTPTRVPTEAPTRVPTETPEATEKSIQQSRNEIQNNTVSFKISGVPKHVSKTSMPMANETEANADVIHYNTIGLNTEGFLADPGCLTVGSLREENQCAWSTTRSDVQKVFDQPGPSYWGAPEGGFVMFTGAYMDLQFTDSNGNPLEISLEPEENHNWFVIVKGKNRDYKTPGDLNNQIQINEYNPGYTTGTRIPPGQFMSQKYFKQNVATSHEENCGADGCEIVSAILIDSNTGGYTVIQQQGKGEPWNLVETNIE